MTSIFFEIKELFRRERLYRLLLVLIIVFYIGVFFLHKLVMTKNDENIVQKNQQQVDQLLSKAPQKPELLEQRVSKRPWLLRSIQLFFLFFLSALGMGIWLLFSTLRRLFLRKKAIPSTHRKLHIAWGISEVVRVVILFFILAIVLNLVLSVYFAAVKFAFDWDSDRSLLMLIHTLLLDTGVIFLIVFSVRKSGAALPDLLGFKFSKFPIREVWWGVRTYLLFLPILMGLLTVLIYLASRLAYEPSTHPLVNILLKDKKLSFGVLFSSLFVACIVGPIVEEIFFRGFFYPALRKYLGVGRTMVVTAILFAMVHENMFAFLPIFFLGLVLCYLYEKRANLLSCISLHMMHNTVFLAYFFLLKSLLVGGK